MEFGIECNPTPAQIEDELFDDCTLTDLEYVRGKFIVTMKVFPEEMGGDSFRRKFVLSIDSMETDYYFHFSESLGSIWKLILRCHNGPLPLKGSMIRMGY